MVNEQDQNGWNSTLPGTGEQNHPSPGSEGNSFEIQVRGHLNSSWSDWLGGMEMKLLDNGEMILSGPIPDQAALMGILNKLVRLNLTLISFNESKTKE